MKHKYKIALFIILAFSACTPTTKDKAFVVDSRTKQLLSDVKVIRESDNQGRITKIQGEFQFKNPKEGSNYTFTKEGYVQKTDYFEKFNGDTILLDPVLEYSSFVIKHNLQSGDTTFIINEETKHINGVDTFSVYQAIYIDPNKSSSYYKRLCDFNVGEHRQYNSVKIKKKQLPKSLPKEWIALHQYKGKYYLYAPCEWIVPRCKITDTTHIWYSNIEGWYGYSYKSIVQKSANHYVINGIMGDFFSEATSLNIYIIDPEKGIAIFDDHGYMTLNVSADKAHLFPIIVNICKGMKQAELEFEEPDFNKLG